jgi:DNA-binding transcriptional LysR family regulator
MIVAQQHRIQSTNLRHRQRRSGGFFKTHGRFLVKAWRVKGGIGQEAHSVEFNQRRRAAAVRTGGGIALLPHFIGREDDAPVACMPEHVVPSRELWLQMRHEGRKDPAIRTVADFLVGLFAGERGSFE